MSGIRDQGSGMRNQGSGIRDQGPGTRLREAGCRHGLYQKKLPGYFIIFMTNIKPPIYLLLNKYGKKPFEL